MFTKMPGAWVEMAGKCVGSAGTAGQNTCMCLSNLAVFGDIRFLTQRLRPLREFFKRQKLEAYSFISLSPRKHHFYPVLLVRSPRFKGRGHRLYFSLRGVSNNGQTSLICHVTENADDRFEENISYV